MSTQQASKDDRLRSPHSNVSYPLMQIVRRMIHVANMEIARMMKTINGHVHVISGGRDPFVTSVSRERSTFFLLPTDCSDIAS